MSVTTILWLRFAKTLAVALYASGALGTLVARDLETRRRFAYLLAGPGFGLAWVFGFLLTFATGRSLLSAFILLSLVLSMTSLQGVLYLAGAEGRGGPISRSVVVLPLIATFALMVFRPSF